MARWTLAACIVLLAVFYAKYDWSDPRRPHSAALSDGWWSFSDQGRYLIDTAAWAMGDLSPEKHYYLPGYALLAAPFVWITPANPFLLPDLALLLLSLWLTISIVKEVAPGRPLAQSLAAVAVTVLTAQPAFMEIWVTPWTTTPATALMLGCLLSLARMIGQRASCKPAFLGSMCASGLLAIRPTDGALFLAVTGVTILGSSWANRLDWRRSLRVAFASACGVLVPATLAVLAYVAEHGFSVSPYLQLSAYIGFGWQLLTIQWVALVLSPQPLLPEGSGLLSTFPVIATGLAGMAACLAKPPGGGRRSVHVVLIAATIAHGILYLCYRDIHPPALWRFYNYHYFKFTLVMFIAYSVLLVFTLREPRCIMAALLVLLAVLPWRLAVTSSQAQLSPPVSRNRLELPAQFDMRTALIAGASGSFEDFYGGVNQFYMDNGAQWYGSVGRIVVYPLPGSILVVPVYPVAPGPGFVNLDSRVSLSATIPPRIVHISLVYGRPCFLPHWLFRGGRECQFRLAP